MNNNVRQQRQQLENASNTTESTNTSKNLQQYLSSSYSYSRQNHAQEGNFEGQPLDGRGAKSESTPRRRFSVPTSPMGDPTASDSYDSSAQVGKDNK